MFIKNVLVLAGLLSICAPGAYSQGDPGELDTLAIGGGPLVLGMSRALTFKIVNDFAVGGFTGALKLATIDGGMAQFDSVVYAGRYLDPKVHNFREFQQVDAATIVFSGVTVDFTGDPTLLPLPPGDDIIAYLYFTGLSIGQMSIDSGFHPPAFQFVFTDDNGYTYIPQFELFSVSVLEEAPPVCGDANGDGVVNVGDAVFTINYVFKNGSAPDPLCTGNANGDEAVNVGDAVYLINYVFKQGTPPIEPCCR